MNIETEFTTTYRIEQRYYRRGEFQRVRSTLFAEDELLFAEDSAVGAKKGALAGIIKQMDSLGGLTFDCSDCRYKVGDYRGDPGYLLYLIFRHRIRLQFVKLKLRLLKIVKKCVFSKCKATDRSDTDTGATT